MLMVKFESFLITFNNKLTNSENFRTPRNLINSWEKQATSFLHAKNLSSSFESISQIIQDEEIDAEVKKASKILYWGLIWRQSKTKEEVVVSWSRILEEIVGSNYENVSQSQNAEYSGDSQKGRVDFPAVERIKELLDEGISPEEIIMRGFSFKKVTEALKDGA